MKIFRRGNRPLWFAFCLLIIAQIIGLNSAALAVAATRPISVSVDDNFPPLLFRNTAGELQGLSRDLWNLWSTKTGIPVEFNIQPFPQGKQAVIDAQADVIDLITINEERKQQLDFSTPYISLDVAIYFHKSISGIVDAKSSRGFLIGAIEGHASTQKLLEAGSVNLKYYKNYDALFAAVANGEIRVFCSHEQQAGYYLNRAGLADEFRHSPPIFSLSGHWAVKKGNDALFRQIKDGFARITPAERQAVFDKWLGVPVTQTDLPVYLRYAGWMLLALAGLALLLIMWNRMLSARVASKTQTLTRAFEDLKLAQISTAATQEHLLSILDAIPDLLVELDATGKVIEAHSARETKAGFQTNQLIGKCYWELHPRRLPKSFAKVWRQLASTALTPGAITRSSIRMAASTGLKHRSVASCAGKRASLITCCSPATSASGFVWSTNCSTNNSTSKIWWRNAPAS